MSGVSENKDGVGGNKDNIKSIYDFIKNPRTGDFIITYVVIFIFAWIALLVTKSKSKKVLKKNKKV